MTYLLVFALEATLTVAPQIALNCDKWAVDDAIDIATTIQKTTLKNATCQKREGIYEWLCSENNVIWTLTVKKDLADCKATPDRTLDLLKKMMGKKPTL